MSSEVRIKEEPVDNAYEQPSIVAGPPADNVAVKQEAQQADPNDDYAWVTDELDFLNEIDDLDTEDDQPPEVAIPVNVKKEPEPETNAVASTGGDKVALSLDKTIASDAIRIKVEKDDRGKSQGELANGLAAESTCISNITIPGGVSSEIADSALKENDRVYGSDRGSGSGLNVATDTSNTNIADGGNVGTELPVSSLPSMNSSEGCPAGVNGLIFPLRIKQEKSPPREIPTLPPPIPPRSFTVPPPPPREALALAPPLPPRDSSEACAINGLNSTALRVKQERLTPPRDLNPTQVDPATDGTHQPTAEPRSRSKSPKRRRSSSKSPDKANAGGKRPSPMDADATFLKKQREKILKAQRKAEKSTASTSGQPSSKRRAIAKEVPQPIRIKAEPLDDNRASNAIQSSNCTPVDMELDSDKDQSPVKNPVVKNPIALKLMPQPLRVKQEPEDTYERETTTSLYSIKTEKSDDKPMSHRQRVLKFAKETIRNIDLFESIPKLKRRFLYTPTILLRENADKLNENRSPLNSSTGIQYEFSSQKQPLNTEQWGICKLREPTAKIVRLLGFNAYEFSQRRKCQKLEKLDADDTQTLQANDSAAFFVNMATQTEQLKCNKCIVRQLKMFSDSSTQASMAAVNSSSSASSELYENIPRSMLETMSQLAPAQHTALLEFTELILGPSPTSTNDVQRMRERLMDIFTLAQSQGGNKLKSFSATSETSPSVLFNQRDHSRHKPLQQVPFHRNPSSQGHPIPTISHQLSPMQSGYHHPMEGTSQMQPSHGNYPVSGVSQMQPSQGNYPVSGVPQMQPSQGNYRQVGSGGPQPVPAPYPHSAPLFPAAGLPQPVPPPYAGQLYDPNNPTGYPYQQAAVRDPRSNTHLPVGARRW